MKFTKINSRENFMPHGRSVVAVPREARRAEIAQELGQIFRSPRVRQKEEQGTEAMAVLF